MSDTSDDTPTAQFVWIPNTALMVSYWLNLHLRCACLVMETFMVVLLAHSSRFTLLANIVSAITGIMLVRIMCMRNCYATKKE